MRPSKIKARFVIGQDNRLRRIGVAKNLNTKVGIGGQACNLIQFRLKWHNKADEIIKTYSAGHLPYQLENPCLAARTVDEEPTAALARLKTKIHTPGEYPSMMRYRLDFPLGAGNFGEVYQATDVDSGNITAFKIIKRPKMGWDEKALERV